MKKIILSFAIIVASFTSTTAFAAFDSQSIQDAVAKVCVGMTANGNFVQGYQCEGVKKEIFYIKDKEVTKVVFDTEKKNYDAKGDICDKTQKTKSGDLPEGYSMTCVKGKYAEYFIAGKKVSFSEFITSINGAMFSEGVKSVNAAALVELNKQMKVLKSLKTFTAALETLDEGTYGFIFPIVGSKCIGSGDVTYNRNGYKNMVCENNKVISLDYYLKDKKVTYNTYVKNMYKTSKDNIKEALKNLKK